MGIQVNRMEFIRVSKYNIVAIPTNMVDMLWTKLEPLLQLVADISPKNEFSLEHVKERAKKGDTLIIAVCLAEDIIAALTLEVMIFPAGKKSLCLPMIGGEFMEEWMLDFLDLAKAIAKDFNCTELRGFAVRKGWLRKARIHNQDWHEEYAVVTHQLG